MLSGQPLPPAPAMRSGRPRLPGAGLVGAVHQDHKPSSAPTRDGQSKPQTLVSVPSASRPFAVLAPPLTHPCCQGQRLTLKSLPAPTWSLCQAPDAHTVLTLGTLLAPREDDTAASLIH